MRYIYLFFMTLLISVPSTSRAEDSNQTSNESGKMSKTPVKKLAEATDDLLEGLSDKQLRQYRAIRSAHGLIRSIDSVRSTIDRGVTACAENNPGMADELEKRFLQWKRSLRPHLSEAKDKRDDMVVLQSFTQPKQVRKHLKLFDRAVAYKKDLFERTPVSEAEACREMMDTMQSTQKRLIKLLKERLKLYDQLQGKGNSGE